MPQPRSAAAACLLDCGIALDEQRAKIPLSEGNYADIKGIAALIAAHCDSIKIIEIDILTVWLISVLEQGVFCSRCGPTRLPRPHCTRA